MLLSERDYHPILELLYVLKTRWATCMSGSEVKSLPCRSRSRSYLSLHHTHMVMEGCGETMGK
jgi:hypothetical protein